jgi:uncharacterized FlgJ-related protein
MLILNNNITNNIILLEKRAEKKIETKLTKSNLKQLLKETVFNSEEVFKQMLLESGHLKSKKTTSLNNISGMRCVKKRKTTQCGCSDDNYGIYKSWQDCVTDYKYYQEDRKMKKSVKTEQYYNNLLKWKYCSNKSYIQILKKINGIVRMD